MKILMSGSTGLIGSDLVPFLQQKGHQVARLVRKKTDKPDQEIYWNPDKEEIDQNRLEGFDAVIHLAGENIVNERWTQEKKERIRLSRVKGTRFLCESLMKLQDPPQTVIAASAVGFYGDRGMEILHEYNPKGKGFLADLCQDWEEAFKPIRTKRARLVHLRLGAVLTPKGGALAKMLSPFKKGVGAILGNGKQYLSWITIDDLLAIFEYVLTHQAQLQGPVNAVSPNPVTQKKFAKTLGKVLGKPVFMKVPAFACRLLFGEMADEVLLASARAEPANLTATGFKFQYPDLEEALKHELK